MSTAWLSWRLEVECPKCSSELDLNNTWYDPDNEIGEAIFNNRWKSLNGFQVTCEFCQHDFVLENVEY